MRRAMVWELKSARTFLTVGRIVQHQLLKWVRGKPIPNSYESGEAISY